MIREIERILDHEKEEQMHKLAKRAFELTLKKLWPLTSSEKQN